MDFQRGQYKKKNGKLPDVPGGHVKINWKSGGGVVVDINIGYNFFPEEPNSLIIFHVKTGVRVLR